MIWKLQRQLTHTQSFYINCSWRYTKLQPQSTKVFQHKPQLPSPLCAWAPFHSTQ